MYALCSYQLMENGKCSHYDHAMSRACRCWALLVGDHGLSWCRLPCIHDLLTRCRMLHIPCTASMCLCQCPCGHDCAIMQPKIHRYSSVTCSPFSDASNANFYTMHNDTFTNQPWQQSPQSGAVSDALAEHHHTVGHQDQDGLRSHGTCRRRLEQATAHSTSAVLS